ncbi:hypothetical protein L6452_44493 [Arctium lappa]|uniref:Uncharacterized protein n=1 Tax=Arctium lappa TaxID=4217 RepID=A0ACB8XGJ2_ARCLA|nr:hypothetical protein L6452_44493 [Arctium lappa]
MPSVYQLLLLFCFAHKSLRKWRWFRLLKLVLAFNIFVMVFSILGRIVNNNNVKKGLPHQIHRRSPPKFPDQFQF